MLQLPHMEKDMLKQNKPSLSSTDLNLVLMHHIEPPLLMLISAVEQCPDDVWARSEDNPPVWQHFLHTVYFLDKWIRLPGEPFQPPSFVEITAVAFTAASEPAVKRAQLFEYLQDVVERCRHLLATSDNDRLLRTAEINGGVYTLMDQILGQTRHISFHMGCVSALLIQYTGRPLQWIGYEGLK